MAQFGAAQHLAVGGTLKLVYVAVAICIYSADCALFELWNFVFLFGTPINVRDDVDVAAFVLRLILFVILSAKTKCCWNKVYGRSHPIPCVSINRSMC